MYRERCRPKYSDDELAEIYSRPWAMEQDWLDHVDRQKETEELARQIIKDDCRTAADLSCGDARWAGIFPDLTWTLGDYAEGYDFQGPIEETIEQIDPVDVFFCCETIEHLDDPDYVLSRIRLKTERLILSTPKSYQWDENPEHYWAFDNEAVLLMLLEAGFRKAEYREANGWNKRGRVNGYAFQIWGCV